MVVGHAIAERRLHVGDRRTSDAGDVVLPAGCTERPVAVNQK